MQTFVNQLVYFGFFQSLFLLCVYLFSPKNRKNINGYIAFLIFVLLIGLSGRVLYVSKVFGDNFRLITLSEFAILLFGPTVFLFTKSSLAQQRFSSKDLIHYVPGFFYILFVVFYFMVPSDKVIVARIQSGELYSVVSIFVGTGLIFNSAYWVLSLQHFLRFRNNLKNELSYTIKTQFFFNFLMAIGGCLLTWTALYLTSLFGFEKIEREGRQFIWMSIAFVVLFIAYYGMVAPNLFRIQSFNLSQKYSQSKLSHTDLDELKTRLEGMMIAKKPYLNAKLMKAELAKMLGISNPELARLLNERIGMNFFDFVNYYRIKEFIALAKTEKAQNLTFFGLAQEAGFNSKTTFNKSFKSLMGTSPSTYFRRDTTS
ncbi:helix-turn-helix domain-containing protein [Flagellimonas pacifica]|uniref:Helix-turn-helix domain-containing protein n=1 Tax=Flagellimonas pacifica TaxID=1247520 RepID=A0A285MG76_9FLAO|nr:helix-turn-helix domain-containing protein [Allomuricauda parva]SNY94946.1 Helix-turn-helix domain-containing protein [Allomuricauda parva]